MQKSVCLYLFLFISFTVSSLLYAEPRHALLIANGEYACFPNLGTPISEARELKHTLEQLDFFVTIVENGSREKILDSLSDFENTLKKCGGIGFFHYGGHAVQVRGKNYLIPVDADIPDERRVASRAIDIDELMMSMVADANIVILDACRNNPLPATSDRSATRGLVLITDRPRNSIIVYSAQAGKVAQDGVFTPILTKKLLEKKSLINVLMDVRREVRKQTNNDQSPCEYSELEVPVYLAGMSSEQKNEQPKSPSSKTAEEYFQLGEDAYNVEDYSTAVEYYRKAAEQGYAAAQFHLGYCYANGRGVPQNYAKAVEWYQKAAEQGYASAQNNLGFCYTNGQGVPQNYAKAIEWYQKAAEQGYAAAQHNLGGCYYKGQGVPQNYAKAVEWCQKAAEQGYASAQFHLGYCYANGRGVPQNYAKAVEWYQKAADQGYATAQYNLGNCYYFGEGVSQNYAKAAEWHQKAAEQGDAEAQNDLGSYYYNGQGVPQNYSKAVEWYQKAAEQGDERAKEKVNELSVYAR